MNLRAMQLVLIVFLLPLPAGCVTGGDPGSEPAALTAQAPAAEISGVPDFPPGRYVHAVSLDIHGHGSHQMRGVMKLADGGMNLIGLSPMGTTVFKIDDRFAEEQVAIEIFQSELQAHQDKILAFYRQLRPILAGKRLHSAAYSQLAPAGWDVRFFENRRHPPLPPTIAVRSEKFSLSIEVEQYEP